MPLGVLNFKEKKSLLFFNSGTMWENWALLGSIFVCVPALMLLKENYNRLTVDEAGRQIPIEVNIDDRPKD